MFKRCLLWSWHNSAKIAGALTTLSIIAVWIGGSTIYVNSKKHLSGAYYAIDTEQHLSRRLDYVESLTTATRDSFEIHKENDERNFTEIIMPTRARATVPRRRELPPLRSFYNSDSAYDERLRHGNSRH